MEWIASLMMHVFWYLKKVYHHPCPNSIILESTRSSRNLPSWLVQEALRMQQAGCSSIREMEIHAKWDKMSI